MYHATYASGFSQLVIAASFERAVKHASECFKDDSLICVLYLKDVTVIPNGIWHTKEDE